MKINFEISVKLRKLELKLSKNKAMLPRQKLSCYIKNKSAINRFSGLYEKINERVLIKKCIN